MKKTPLRKARRRVTAKPERVATDLGRTLVSSLDRKTIFRELAEGIKAHVRYDRLVVLERQKGKRIERVFTAPPGQKATADGASLNEEEKRIFGRVARRKQPYLWQASRPVKGGGAKALSAWGFASYLGLPLIHRGQVLGSLHLGSKRPKAYGPMHLHLLQAVAAWLALSMDNALLYEKVKSQNDDLKRATEYKSQFLARMSHEIRTPLGVLIGFLDILHSGTLGPVNDEQRTALDKMQSQSRRLQKMINDVLSLSRIEEGSVPLEISTFPLEKIMEPVRTLVDDLKRKSPLQVVWDIEPDLPTLRTDAPKLEEILQNLIVNAFKYTRQGEVRIRIKNLAERRRVQFIVEDTGLGIAPQNVSKIFEGFHQIDATTSSQGVGLGLTIVKKFVDLLEGDIEVQTQPGKGSSFKVTLPHVLED
ncbi:MAG TPA: GAF domain-containing sensor histidine kinase [Candidatus Binatia bacterium]